MKKLQDILNVSSSECTDEELETTILEAVAVEEATEVEKPAAADKVTLAMANLSDMTTMADEIYHTFSEMEEIEEEMVEKVKNIFISLDELYKEVDEKYDIDVPVMGPTEVEEAEELLGSSLDSILNEDAKTIQMKGLEELKGKREILTAMYGAMRKMRKADLQASYKYMKASHCMASEGDHTVGKRDEILASMMKDLKAMKVADLKDSYGYLKANYGHDAPVEDEMVNAAHCMDEAEEISEGLGINFSKVSDDGLLAWTAWAKFQVKKNPEFKQDLKDAEREIKRRKLEESLELEEMKTKDDDLAVFVYDFIGADTEGKPLKTLIKQAVGKYFGSQKDKEETEER